MADHNIQRMSGDSPFRSAADKATTFGGWSMHESETVHVIFKQQPTNKKEPSHNNVMHKKFYNDFGDLFSQEY
uniref:Uncharacterized protein n=1 Tax=Panagrolaimus superbus TaxID=310955 RepID=A0A914YYK4_9BILA